MLINEVLKFREDIRYSNSFFIKEEWNLFKNKKFQNEVKLNQINLNFFLGVGAGWGVLFDCKNWRVFLFVS